MNRNQAMRGIAAAVLSWYGMMVVHEAGHCLGALVTGARIGSVEVPLVGFSRTVLTRSRRPALAVWAGPVFGATAPLALLLFLKAAAPLARHVLRFFAGLCLLANGLYIGIGAFLLAGDCLDLRRCGSPLWLELAFGAACTCGGLYAWHRMGPLPSWFASHSGTRDPARAERPTPPSS
jgi:hypothetical protein